MASDSDEMRAVMIRVLRSNPTMGISFGLAGFTVMPYGYGYVADLLAQGLYVINLISNGYAGGFDDSGLFGFDRSLLDTALSPSGRATIVHEATHAAISVTHPGMSILRADNEFAAYLAQAIYASNAGDPGVQDAFIGAPMSAFAAKAIASTDSPYLVSAADADDLELAIMYAYTQRAQAAGRSVPYIDIMKGAPTPPPWTIS